MLFGPDWLANLFMFIFLFGLIFTIASLALGMSHAGGMDTGGQDIGHDIGAHDVGAHDFGHDFGAHDAHLGDAGHAGTGSADATQGVDNAPSGPSPLNMPTIMAFLTWFGGAGFIFRSTLALPGIVVVPMAVISGVTGGGIMFLMLARWLWPMMSKPMRQADYNLPGTSARVVSPIRAGGVGEIVYTKQGVRFTAGARSHNGRPIAAGTEVVILSYERGIASVQDVDAMLNGEIPDRKSEVSLTR